MRTLLVCLVPFLLGAVNGVPLLAQAGSGQQPSASPTSWRADVSPPGEPGEPLIVSGVVRDHEGRPRRGAVVYVYQTDARGYYSADGRDERNPRLRGVMRTDADGRYEFRTIRPAPYPGNRIPAHVHITVDGSAVPELWFEGDPYLRGQRGGIARPVTRGADGVLRVQHEIVVG